MSRQYHFIYIHGTEVELKPLNTNLILLIKKTCAVQALIAAVRDARLAGVVVPRVLRSPVGFRV